MTTAHAAPPRTSSYDAESGPNGWVAFAAIALTVGGIMRIFDAIWAFRYNGALPGNLEDAIFGHSLNTYGWDVRLLVVPGLTVRPVDRCDRRRRRGHQRSLVDAVLPDLVADLYRSRRPGDLRARGARITLGDRARLTLDISAAVASTAALIYDLPDQGTA